MQRRKTKTKIKKRKVVAIGCYFCEQNSVPYYLNDEELARFMSDRAKIIAKEFSGLCSKHQRKLGIAIKRARHLAILPFRAGI